MCFHAASLCMQPDRAGGVLLTQAYARACTVAVCLGLRASPSSVRCACLVLKLCACVYSRACSHVRTCSMCVAVHCQAQAEACAEALRVCYLAK